MCGEMRDDYLQLTEVFCSETRVYLRQTEIDLQLTDGICS